MLINFRRSIEAYSNFSRFLIVIALPITTAFLLLFIGNIIGNGWRDSYDVSLAITSPFDGTIGHPWLAFPLSFTSWLMLPVLAGAVVSYAVTSSVDRRRRGARIPAPRDGDQQRGRDRGPKFSRIPRLRDRVGTERFGIPNSFVDYFLGLHHGDWRSTQDHFEREVVHVLQQDAADANDPQGVAMRLGVGSSVSILSAARFPEAENSSGSDLDPKGYCPYCPRSQSVLQERRAT